MTNFRPCIDLHEGRVKQIVGGTLSEDDSGLRTNFESEKPPSWYAELYRREGLNATMTAAVEEPSLRHA